MTPRQLCAAFIEDDGPPQDPIRPGLSYRQAFGDCAARLWRVPELLAHAAAGRAFARRWWLEALERLGQALPVGLFSNAPPQARLHGMFSIPGRSDDVRELKRRLVSVATDVDSGTAAPFCQPGWDTVAISQAMAARATLPGRFPPVPIKGPEGSTGPAGRRWLT
jgi:predicted acylesterase/phospholipase RssA